MDAEKLKSRAERFGTIASAVKVNEKTLAKPAAKVNLLKAGPLSVNVDDGMKKKRAEKFGEIEAKETKEMKKKAVGRELFLTQLADSYQAIQKGHKKV
jgi:hypothetical protein